MYLVPDGKRVLVHGAHLLVQLTLLTLFVLQHRQVLLKDVRDMRRLIGLVLITHRCYHRLNNLILRTERLLVKQS